MKITNRFTVAVHALLCIHAFSRRQKVTSEFIAASVNVNPVVIRRTLGQLKEAGLVEIARGTGGSMLARRIENVSLLDVYRAVESLKGDLFNFHENPSPACPVGRNIHKVLDGHLVNAQKAMESSLKKVKLSELVSDLSLLLDAS
jgi:Rrf2 family protein